MILSTSTNLFCERPGGTVKPLTETIPAMASAGFKTLDLSFYEYAYPDQPTSWFIQETWEQELERIARAAEESGVRFVQSHAYTYHFMSTKFPEGSEARKRQDELVKRSFLCCSRLGAKMLVVHPDMSDAPAACPSKEPVGAAAASGDRNAPSHGDPLEMAARVNREVLGGYIELADKLGMKIAVEGMLGYAGDPKRPFIIQPDELAEYIRSFHDERIGVCWDFEHGQILGLDNAAAVRTIGKTLYATHVSDTVTKDFEPFMHVLPFTGIDDWNATMAALADIQYEGCFSFEAHNFIKKLPDALVSAALQYAHAVGSYLVDLGNQGRDLEDNL
jgi:L-ribulose-5-phosphate 3-epimerase